MLREGCLSLASKKRPNSGSASYQRGVRVHLIVRVCRSARYPAWLTGDTALADFLLNGAITVPRPSQAVAAVSGTLTPTLVSADSRASGGTGWGLQGQAAPQSWPAHRKSLGHASILSEMKTQLRVFTAPLTCTAPPPWCPAAGTVPFPQLPVIFLTQSLSSSVFPDSPWIPDLFSVIRRKRLFCLLAGSYAPSLNLWPFWFSIEYCTHCSPWESEKSWVIGVPWVTVWRTSQRLTSAFHADISDMRGWKRVLLCTYETAVEGRAIANPKCVIQGQSRDHSRRLALLVAWRMGEWRPGDP